MKLIHYHGTPFGGDEMVAIRSLQRRHAMISFAEPRQLEVAAEVCQSFCFDNGAFTAWKQGKPFDPEKYAEWVSEWHLHPGFDFYVMPDVIDADADANLKMLGKWSNLVDWKVWNKGAPVWHMHEPIEVLRDLCHAHSRVCLGSSGEYAVVGSTQWWQRISSAMEFICDDDGRPPCKLHGLRMLDPTVFSHIPLASADSTNVARNNGIDSRWRGTYIPKNKETRSQIIMERIEMHGACSKWGGSGVGAAPNGELFG